MLKIPPVNYTHKTKLPGYVVLQKSLFCKHASGPIEESFTLISTKNSQEKAYMYCTVENVYRKDFGWVKSLYISYLNSLENSGNGFGTILLNIAKKYSETLGCKGRFHLDASSISSPNRVPHVFYRKYGMNTGLSRIDNSLDNFIKKNKNATEADFGTVTMFYPPIETPGQKKLSILQRLLVTLHDKFIK